MTSGRIPEWDLADRMRKSMRDAGVSREEMAAYLEVSPGTVSTWINGRNRPSAAALRVWAMHTGTDYAWLSGDEDPKTRGASPTRRVGFRKPGRRPALHGLAAAAIIGAAGALAGAAA